ncbi:hypothetical protein SRHO_G00150460 [Serrasalmus rhombeus]
MAARIKRERATQGYGQALSYPLLMDSQVAEGSHLIKPYSSTCPKLRDTNRCALARTDGQVHKRPCAPSRSPRSLTLSSLTSNCTPPATEEEAHVTHWRRCEPLL